MVLSMLELSTTVATCRALQSCAALVVSHLLCSALVMYMDMTGRWSSYSLHKKRAATPAHYLDGVKSFFADQLLMFLPFMTVCYTLSETAISECTDEWYVSLPKLCVGYTLGKVWATLVHYLLHMPSLYRFHRRHHQNPNRVVASAAWEDSMVEYALMELPSFGITVLLFPTHFVVHLLHFVLHGYDGAANHSGFGGMPGVLGYLFDGTYHYHHHNLLTVNYAEIQLLDYMFGTHHSYRPSERQEPYNRLKKGQ